MIIPLIFFIPRFGVGIQPCQAIRLPFFDKFFWQAIVEAPSNKTCTFALLPVRKLVASDLCFFVA